MTSKIDVLHHALLAAPDFSEKQQALQNALVSMKDDSAGQDILKNLEIKNWELMDNDEAEFLIDMLDTLTPD